VYVSRCSLIIKIDDKDGRAILFNVGSSEVRVNRNVVPPGFSFKLDNYDQIELNSTSSGDRKTNPTYRYVFEYAVEQLESIKELMLVKCMLPLSNVSSFGADSRCDTAGAKS
jgi:hypothetical protein